MYDAESLIHLIKSGVRGFLKKDIAPGELKNAFHSILVNGIILLSNDYWKTFQFNEESWF